MVQQTDADENKETDSLTETHAAIILRRDRYRRESRLDGLVKNARQKVAEKWWSGSGEQVEKIHRITHNEHYTLDQLGWEIYADPNSTPAVRMVVVTPVPDWEESDLDRITREFIHEMKAMTIQSLEKQRQRTTLTPREFTALFVEGGQRSFFQKQTSVFGVAKSILAQDAQTARAAVEQTEAIHELLPRSARDEILSDSSGQ